MKPLLAAMVESTIPLLGPLRMQFKSNFSRVALAVFMVLASLNVQAEAAKRDADAGAGLTADFIYKYLVGEIAGQRGEIGLASALLLDLAKTSRDPRLAERATRAALYGNQAQIAMRAAVLWMELDPESTESRQILTQLLLAAGKVSDLRPHMQKLIAEEEDKAGIFTYLVGMFARSTDKPATLKLMQELAKPYPELAEAHFAVAHAAWSAGKEGVAKSELQVAEQQKPGWEQGALLRGQILQGKAPVDALKFYHDFLDTYPSSNDVRMAYAKLLVNEKQLESARDQFDQLVDAAPDSAEIQIVVGLLNVQLEDYSAAGAHFRKALEIGVKDAGQVQIYLGQVAERMKKNDEALEWYAKVLADSQQYLDAQLRSAVLVAKDGNLELARQKIKAIPDLTQEQQVVAIQTEASLLGQAKRTQEAFEVLRDAVETMPNSPELIYDYAMMAERVQRFDVMEKELRKLILIKPDMGHAYNALGYSLADRNERLDEAQKLIEKALSLSPSDHFILDSMGWVKYRRGQLSQAVEYLRRAYKAQSDPEIAAHLGEVLWHKGQHDEAEQIVSDALRDHPDNEVLIDTAKKFQQ